MLSPSLTAPPPASMKITVGPRCDRPVRKMVGRSSPKRLFPMMRIGSPAPFFPSPVRVAVSFSPPAAQESLCGTSLRRPSAASCGSRSRVWRDDADALARDHAERDPFPQSRGDCGEIPCHCSAGQTQWGGRVSRFCERGHYSHRKARCRRPDLLLSALCRTLPSITP